MINNFEKLKNIAKEEFNVDIKKNNNPSSFEELFFEYNDCSKDSTHMIFKEESDDKT